MDLNQSFYYFVLGAGGAGAAEMLKLYEDKNNLTLARYRKRAVSPLFWGAVAGMLLASGFVAWAVHADSPDATPFQLIISGIGARSLARGSVTAGLSKQPVQLGDDDDKRISLRDIFL